VSKKTDQKAEQLLATYVQFSPPIDIEKIARGEGARIIRQPLDHDVSGILLRDDSQVLLGVNAAHHLRRQRFTIAHELGHLSLHPGRPYTVDSTIRLNWRDDLSSLATDRQEIEANAFAAAVLMPEKLVREAVKSLRPARNTTESRLIDLLARQFDVSTEAMSFRLVNLGIRS
jgi:Zn-dependent peptidase ImmA (M78 family)